MAIDREIRPDPGTATAALKEKVALVTGGSRGIGRAISRRLARHGARVALTYAGNQRAAQDTVESIRADGGDAIALQVDIADPVSIDRLFEQIDGQLLSLDGAGALDILVNNAGIGLFSPLLSTSRADMQRVIGTNIGGTVLVSQQAAPRLREGGRIVTISSGLSRRPSSPFGIYSMSKAALDALTTLLAIELAPRRITANTVAPGWTATDINAAARSDPSLVADVVARTALGRLGQPDDIASVVAFLASSDGDWVTGQYIEASGGYGLA